MAIQFQRSFAAGEISPTLYTRVDTIKYAYGLATCRNFYIGKSGGAINRPGFKSYIEAASIPGFPAYAYRSRLIPISGSSESTTATSGVMLEITPIIGTRVIKDGVPIPNEGGFFSSSRVYQPGDYVNIGATNYICIKTTPLNTPPPNTTYWFAQTTPDMRLPFYDVDAQYIQNGKAIIFASRTTGVVEISSTGNAGVVWAVRPISAAGGSGLGPVLPAPTGVSVAPSGGGSAYYVVTAISNADFEESIASAQVIPADGELSEANPRTVSWSAVPGAYGYNVYRNFKSRFGLVTTTTLTSFRDNNVSADYTEVPPELRTDLTDPIVIGQSQQRLLLANTTAVPEGVWASRIGSQKNFSRKFAGKPDESSSFKLNGSGQIKAVLEVSKTWIFTEKAEYSCSAITRTGPEDLKLESSNGSGTVPPIAIGQSAVYLQQGNSIVRGLGFDQNGGGLDGYSEGDLTTYSSHLFEGHSIVSWAYQQRPDSLIWAVRDDGTLLCLTFMKQEQIVAWHRHDTDGFCEAVAARAEGLETAIYLTVRRMVNGVEKRFHERMTSRYPRDQRDYCFLDAAVTYDGRNKQPGRAVTLSNGVNWDEYELTTLKLSSVSGIDGDPFVFKITDQGKEYHITIGTKTVRLSVVEFISNTEVTVRADSMVPAAFRNTPLTSWARADNEVTAPNLNGREVSVFADGYVVASANNPQYPTAIVAANKVALDQCYSVIQVGLPYTSDLETLDIDTAQSETTANKKIHVGKVTLQVEASKGIFVGSKFPAGSGVAGLEEMRPTDVNYTSPSGMFGGKITTAIDGTWANGRTVVRQTEPLPLNILGIAPEGKMFTSGG